MIIKDQTLTVLGRRQKQTIMNDVVRPSAANTVSGPSGGYATGGSYDGNTGGCAPVGGAIESAVPVPGPAPANPSGCWNDPPDGWLNPTGATLYHIGTWYDPDANPRAPISLPAAVAQGWQQTYDNHHHPDALNYSEYIDPEDPHLQSFLEINAPVGSTVARINDGTYIYPAWPQIMEEDDYVGPPNLYGGGLYSTLSTHEDYYPFTIKRSNSVPSAQHGNGSVIWSGVITSEPNEITGQAYSEYIPTYRFGITGGKVVLWVDLNIELHSGVFMAIANTRVGEPHSICSPIIFNDPDVDLSAVVLSPGRYSENLVYHDGVWHPSGSNVYAYESISFNGVAAFNHQDYELTDGKGVVPNSPLDSGDTVSAVYYVR